MIVTQPIPGVVHLRFASQGEVCRAMVRIQEFYESPYDGIRGQYFSLDTFAATYAKYHDGVYTYDSDWNGFNIPGDVALRFFNVFAADLNFEERAVRHATLGLDKFYVIATWRDEEYTHELAHALYGLKPDYNQRAQMMVAWFSSEVLESKLLCNWLARRGYDESVMADELNAFMATTPVEWWVATFGPIAGAALNEAGEPFRKLLAEYTV